MNTLTRLSLASALAASVAGCSTAPTHTSTVNSLETQYSTLASNANVEQHAPIALKEAKEAVDTVKELVDDGEDKEVIEHHKYLAERKIAIAEQLTRLGNSKAVIERAEVRRKDILLESKDSQIQQAAFAAAKAELRAEMASRKNQQLESEIEQTRAEKEKIQNQYSSAEQRMKALGEKLEGVSTEANERGLVITMADIEFATDEFKLSDASTSQLGEIATFLDEYPERQVLVEGYTDSTGSAEYNDKLSKLRAQSVMDKLVNHGVKRERLDAVGYGEKFPIASNGSAQGRQANRRVEIVIAKTPEETISSRDTF